ncbi:MAG: pilus assembly protein PilM [Candidatus Riflebacteria bacterium]|nr:pilus assembly protein PilM [Candidatus Riflebacteria bacterium]
MSRSGFNLLLDLGTFEMRLLRLESAAPGEIRLSKCLAVESPREFVASTFIEFPIMDPVPVSKAFRSLITEGKVDYENALVLLPDHGALTNLMVSPPRYSKKETEEAIREDFGPIMPLPIENWYIEHTVVGPWEEEEIIVAVAVLKNNVIELGGLLQKAGVNPQAMDTNFFNVANLVEGYLVSEECKGKNVVLVHLGNETTSIGVFRDGQIRTFLNRPIGGYDFTKQISKHFHVPESEADQFKRNEIFFLPESSPEQEGLYNFTVIKNVFSVLTREIFSAIESYLTRFREFSIHEIIVSGGGANFQNIGVILGANFNTKVRPVADLYRLFVSGSEVEAHERNALAPACGAFLRG